MTQSRHKSATDKTVVLLPGRRQVTAKPLVDNKNGTYTYTFARDITKVKDIVAPL